MEVRSKVRDYAVHWADDAEFVGRLDATPNRLTVVDANVWKHHGQGVLAGVDRATLKVFPVSEERKTLDGVCELYDLLMQRAAKKNVTLVCYGGGILQDVAGFAASTLYRGVSWIFAPTTLLAQADSCIGGKTSLNYQSFKNLLGTFYPPTAVYIHTPFLATQSETDYFSGIGEVIKLHILGGPEKTDQLAQMLPALTRRDPAALTAAVGNSLAVKLAYIMEDEFDRGRRNLLNYGHCFGHALETVSRFEIPHGQAVTSGMILANLVAVHRGRLARPTFDSLWQRLLLPGLRVVPRREQLAPAPMIAAMGNDKKRTGAGLALVLPNEPLSLEKIDDLAPAEVERALAAFAELCEEKSALFKTP
jgi:3-dehydroquinate synthase